MKRLLLLILLVGCAPALTIVDRHGMPVPNEVVMLNSVHDIACNFYFVRHYSKGVDSIYPEYLPLEEEVKIDKRTRDVQLVLHIMNPLAVHMRVVKHIIVNNAQISVIIYEGNSVDRTFQINGPIQAGDQVALSADVVIDQLPVVRAGRALYKVGK